MRPHIFKDLTQLHQAIENKDRREALEKLEMIQNRFETRRYPDIRPSTDLEYIHIGLSSIRRDIGEYWSRASKLVHLVMVEVENLLEQGPSNDLDLEIVEFN